MSRIELINAIEELTNKLVQLLKLDQSEEQTEPPTEQPTEPEPIIKRQSGLTKLNKPIHIP